MSVDVKDHRRYVDGKKVEEKERERPEPPKHLLKQVEIAQETGDPRLDKFLRTIAAKIEEHDARCVTIALEAAASIDEKLFRLKQGEFFFNKGIVEVLKEMAQVPARIISEELPSSNLSN